MQSVGSGRLNDIDAQFRSHRMGRHIDKGQALDVDLWMQFLSFSEMSSLFLLQPSSNNCLALSLTHGS